MPFGIVLGAIQIYRKLLIKMNCNIVTTFLSPSFSVYLDGTKSEEDLFSHVYNDIVQELETWKK